MKQKVQFKIRYCKYLNFWTIIRYFFSQALDPALYTIKQEVQKWDKRRRKIMHLRRH